MKNLVRVVLRGIDILVTAALLLAVLLLAAVDITQHTGDKVPGIGPYRIYVVLSDSMKPVFQAGDLVIDKKVPPDSLRVNDVVTYRAQGTDDMLVSHRIVQVEKTQGEAVFITKGDANQQADEHPVSADAVQGQYQLHIPKLGYFFYYLNRYPVIPLYILAVCALAYGVSVLVAGLRGKKRPDGGRASPNP